LAIALPNLKAQSPQTTPSSAVAQSTIAQQDAIAFGGAWLGQSPDGSLTAEITLMIAREKR
jgi:hypothetical protein